MKSVAAGSALFFALLCAPAAAQQEAVQPTRFAGTWVGTQAWAIKDPPPGASKDQQVTLELQVVEG